MKENMTPTTTLLHGDCLELMKDIPDGSIDAMSRLGLRNTELSI